jgi:hypothetical protein
MSDCPARTIECRVCKAVERRTFGNGILAQPCKSCGGQVGYELPWYNGEPGYYGNLVVEKIPDPAPAVATSTNGKVNPKQTPTQKKIILPNRSLAGPAVKPVRIPEPERGRAMRQPLSESTKSEIVEKQGGKCMYCARRLGSMVWDSKGRGILLSRCFDHFEPFALRQNDSVENRFAACKVCNQEKSDHVFDSLKDCRIWLEHRWQELGYQDEKPATLARDYKREFENLFVESTALAKLVTKYMESGMPAQVAG